MSISTPNMNLYQPTIGVDSGLIWEQDLNANASILDTHNHSVGSGVQITPAGLNLNTDLAFEGNNAIDLRSTRYDPQGTPLNTAADLNCVYVSGVDLYYNDGNGNQVKITAGGTVNATSSGIVSGTASASFVASVLTVLSAPNTPASIKGGSLLLGNTGVLSSNYVTLSPPTTTPNYSLVLPSLPAQTNVMSLTAGGTMGSVTWDFVGQSMTSVGANAIATSRTRSTGTSVGAGGVAISSGITSFTTSSTTFVTVTGISITLTTSGRPVQLMIISNGTGGSSLNLFPTAGGNQGTLAYARAGTAIASQTCSTPSSSNTSFPLPGGYIDVVSAGTYTYTLQMKVSDASTTLGVSLIKLVAYEL